MATVFDLTIAIHQTPLVDDVTASLEVPDPEVLADLPAAARQQIAFHLLQLAKRLMDHQPWREARVLLYQRDRDGGEAVAYKQTP